MAAYYIEDPNGKYHSEDKSRNFRKLTGQEAYRFLKSAEGSLKNFLNAKDSTDKGDGIYVEVPEAYVGKLLVSKRHDQYLNDCKRNHNYQVISLYALEDNDEDWDMISGEELIADENEDVFEIVSRKMDIERLREALKHLSRQEMELIRCFYLCAKPCSVRDYADTSGLPIMTVQHRKKAVLNKLRSFF